MLVNAAAPWEDAAAQRGEVILQLAVGLGAVVCGLVVSARVSGMARWWRLLYVAALVGWLVGQGLWWSDGEGSAGRSASPAVLAAYLVVPVFALASVVVLVRVSGGLRWHPLDAGRDSVATTLLDGLVAATSFMILTVMGDFGAHSTGSLPRSGIPAVEITYSLLELLVVVAVMVMAMLYRPGQPYRANYLLLAGGLVTMAASDRVAAYLDRVGLEQGNSLGGIGFVIGPLLIAYAMLEYPAPGTDADRRADLGMDAAQLILPYVGFLGIAMLFAFHVLTGRPLNGFVVWATVAMVLLVVIRQIVARRAQHLLTQRLYWAQRGLAYQVHHDALTGLPNRLLFGQRLEEAMRNGRFVLIFIDLDDFKEVNDRFGHAAGDDLLRAVGERLKRCITDADTLARIGGDEFAILIDGEADEPQIVADRLRVALRDPFPVQGSSLRVRASMGLVRPDADQLDQTSDDLLRRADISMYAGKRLGKDTAVVYQPSTGVQEDFPTALRRAGGGVPAGFTLAYQPVVRLPGRTPVAVEALARWTAPSGIDIAPQTFVASAEAAGLGAELDALVLELACREVQAAGLDLAIHVNIGAARLGNPAFEHHVRRALTRHDVEPNRLVVEITETVPIVDLADAAAQIDRLQSSGVRVALDDFGAGFNSLMYLHALPVQIVKLDRSFAAGTDPERNLTMYRSVIRLCSELGLSVIVEGIELPPQAETVYIAGCRLAQGHLFGSAVPISQLSPGPQTHGAPV
ncbi:putative signaling protein [Mycolicibacterium vanbaalenii]|uniref:Putative signaling protein n=1 Tax=Mycolicibacterium vanbaalenii TaxID=110539 RepID=A0A5S9R3C4_MYCVN|nr:EAL domain-containing protein [Mycolicibacterium vanbaalenii]CAA0128561.1 putative signaling protein [Mycolicibacterium vanbaalenii]